MAGEFDDLLKAETAFYEREREALLLKYPNRVLLIHGESLVGDFDSEDTAIKAGMEKFGVGPFLVRRSGEDEPVLSAPALTLGLLQCRS